MMGPLHGTPGMRFEKRRVCGRPLFYPDCERSRTLVRLARRVCLEESDLEAVRELGFTLILRDAGKGGAE